MDKNRPLLKGAILSDRTGPLVQEEAAVYLKQVYALLSASLLVAVAAGWVGMRTPFAYEHPILLIVLELGALFLAMRMQNTATLFLFTGLSGFTLGPLMGLYVSAGLSSLVGTAMVMTGGAFVGLTVYSLTTHRSFSAMGGMLFAGLIVILVGGLVNLFLQSSGLAFAMSAMGAMIFSGYILWETQQYRDHPWMVAPPVAALSLYLNVVNLFISLLRLLGFLGGED